MAQARVPSPIFDLEDLLSLKRRNSPQSFNIGKQASFLCSSDVAGKQVPHAYFYVGFSPNFLRFSAFAFLLPFYLSLIYFILLFVSTSLIFKGAPDLHKQSRKTLASGEPFAPNEDENAKYKKFILALSYLKIQFFLVHLEKSIQTNPKLGNKKS